MFEIRQSLAIDESRETRLDFDVITDDNDDDALELYENAEELREEGVKVYYTLVYLPIA